MLLRQDPHNGDAAFGEAQIAYYQDHLALAKTLASALVKDHPENFDMMFLLAAIERARHHEREAARNFMDLIAEADETEGEDE